MGTSTVEFQEKGFWIRDGLLELWLLALVREIDNLEPCPHWLQQARDHWYLQATIGLIGCISTNLDEFVTSEDRTKELITISKNALCSLNEPSLYANNDLYVQPPNDAHDGLEQGWLNAFLLDLPESALHNLLESGKIFVELLRGEWPSGISDKEAVAWMTDCYQRMT